MIKLFCSDLDGTLLIDQRIDGKTSDKIRELKESGVNVALVSGRVYGSIKYLADDSSISPYIIANNGALVRGEDGEIIYENPMDLDDVKKLIDYANEKGFHFHCYGMDTFYSSGISDRYLSHLEVSTNGYDKKYQINILSHNNLGQYLIDENIKIYKIQYVPNNEEEMGETYLDIKDMDSISITKSGKNNIEIMNRGVDKWHAIEALMDYLNISKEEVSAMGDFSNDKKMIENSYFGIAMGNALDDVKEVSSFVTKDYRDHGGVYAMDEILRLNSNV